MNFTGTQVAMSSSKEGVTIKMRDGENTVTLFLEPMEAAQLMTYLMNIFGLADMIEMEEDDVEEKKVTH